MYMSVWRGMVTVRPDNILYIKKRILLAANVNFEPRIYINCGKVIGKNRSSDVGTADECAREESSTPCTC